MSQNKTVQNMQEIGEFKISNNNRLFSANNDEICQGWTTDVYFVRTKEILKNVGLDKTEVVAEIFSRKSGILCGVEEAKNLLAEADVEVWSLPEGSAFAEKEVVMRIKGDYNAFGIYETALLGILASSSGWATASNLCKKAAKDKKMICFGARHLHPAVAPVMERAAVIGGADGCSCILGAKLLNIEPSGTVPHAVFLVMGDSVEVAKAYKKFMPDNSPLIVLVDTFRDEIEEALRVAYAMGDILVAVRLDTPSERGGVTEALVKETRARLDQAGFNKVQIFVSGGLNPERIEILGKAGASSFGVGSFISGACALDMTMDIKEVNGKSIAKRGRIPGITPSSRLVKLK